MSKSKITIEELQKLNTRENAAIAYRGKVYNVTGYLDKHPGGSEQLLLAAGRDVTYFFDSYHAKEIRNLVPQKCRYIGDMEESSNSPPKYSEQDDFYTTLEERVRKYFKSNKLDPKIHVPFFCTSISVAIATLSLWYLAVVSVYNGYSLVIGSTLALLSGFGSVLVTFNSHDISHFAWTHKPWVWDLMSRIYGCVNGFSTYVWHYMHVVGHHVHPNHGRLDPDVSGSQDAQVWRSTPFQKHFPHYAYQYVYLPLLFIVISIRMKIRDFWDFISGRNEVHFNPPTLKQVLTFLLLKAIHFTYRVVLPSFYIPWPSLLLLNLLSEVVTGFWLGFVTQLNHINTAALFPDPKQSSFNMPWSEMQVLATVDYATDSTLWNFLTGGLNSQAIHHLFPSILPVYYKELNPILVRTCAEFGVKYTHFSSMWAAWSSYSQSMKDMGRSNQRS